MRRSALRVRLDADHPIELFQTEKPPDMFRESVVNFSVSWDCLFLPGGRIAINIMPGTVAM